MSNKYNVSPNGAGGAGNARVADGPVTAALP